MLPRAGPPAVGPSSPARRRYAVTTVTRRATHVRPAVAARPATALNPRPKPPAASWKTSTSWTFPDVAGADDSSAAARYTGRCKFVCVGRTNIDIDDDIIARVQATYGLRTKREAVDFALRRLLIEPFTREEALAAEGSGWGGDLDAMRAGTAPRT